MDLGCHPMYIASWSLGKPKRITSMFHYFTHRAVEDNAQCSIEFVNNAVALVETSCDVQIPFCPGDLRDGGHLDDLG